MVILTAVVILTAPAVYIYVALRKDYSDLSRKVYIQSVFLHNSQNTSIKKTVKDRGVFIFSFIS